MEIVKILICIKQVPDAGAQIRIAGNGRSPAMAADGVIQVIGEGSAEPLPGEIAAWIIACRKRQKPTAGAGR